MAVLPICPDLNIEILVNGVPLQEYENDSEEPGPSNTVTKYIEAQSGAEFSIRHISTHNPLGAQHFARRIIVDGKVVCSEVSGFWNFKANEFIWMRV
jgi:hypothetical protein